MRVPAVDFWLICKARLKHISVLRIGLLLVCALLAWPACADPGPTFEVDFSNPGLVPSHWVLEFKGDGSGHFQSHRGTAPPDSTRISMDAPDIDRDIQLSAGFVQHVFQVARRHKLFQSGCESHLKVAFQGIKKLAYSGPDGQGSCEFNFSRDNEIQTLGDSLVAVAATIVEGAKLELLLQHDKLGLDKEMEDMEEAAGDGRLQQIGVIRDILERLEQDSAVMERVRKRAKVLLARAAD
jgi:hypothetical protein